MPYPSYIIIIIIVVATSIPSHIYARKIDTETLTLSLILLSFATIFSTDYKTHSERLLDYVSQMLHFKWFFLESSFVFRGVAGMRELDVTIGNGIVIQLYCVRWGGGLFYENTDILIIPFFMPEV